MDALAERGSLVRGHLVDTTWDDLGCFNFTKERLEIRAKEDSRRRGGLEAFLRQTANDDFGALQTCANVAAKQVRSHFCDKLQMLTLERCKRVQILLQNKPLVAKGRTRRPLFVQATS